MAEHDNAVYRMFNEGNSYAEIARELGITEKQVNHALQRVRKLEGVEERLPDVQKSNDTYIIAARGGNRTISISENKLKLLKELYCGSRLTINQVCRKLDIPRRDFTLIKTAFGITKDDTPFIDEEFYEKDIDELVNETIEKRKDAYFIKLAEKEIEHMRAELNKYRKQDYMIDKIRSVAAEDMKDFARNYAGPKLETQLTEIEETPRRMLEVSTFELHLGKLAWKPETGENYDYKIARQRFHQANNDIYERAKQRQLEKILYVIGNDFFNFDNIAPTTTAGTPQDSDLRWIKLFSVGTQMFIEAIDKYATLAPVEVIVVPGNHDRMTDFYAQAQLMAWYRNTENVTVSDDYRTRKYIEYGKNLIGFTHGDKEGKRIYQLMPNEMPTAWGRTKYREFHVGHWHHEKTVEPNGVIVRTLASLTGTDAWHFEKGFVSSTKKAQSFLWDREDGLQEIWHTNLPQ